MKKINVRIKRKDPVKECENVIDEDAVMVSDDEVYKKAKYLIAAEKEIERLEAEIARLKAIRKKYSCDKLSFDDMLKITNAVNKASKAKYVDDKKN
jgi:hypothetical protein